MDIAANVLSNLQPWWGAIKTIAIIIGIFLAGYGLIGLIKGNRHGHANYGTDIATFIVGDVLISLPAFLDSLSQTFFAQNSRASLYSVSDVLPGTQYASAVALVFAVVQLVGLWAEIKGAMLFKDGFESKDKMGMAWTHMIGGIFALNLMTFLGLVGASMGTTAQGVLMKIIGS